MSSSTNPVQPLSFLHAPTDMPDPPVTVVRDIKVKTGQESEFENFMQNVIEAASNQPGYVGAALVRPQSTGQAYRFVYKFDRQSNLQKWQQSETDVSLGAGGDAFIESDRVDQYPGLETWFDLPNPPAAATPPKWKTTILSFVAVYPTVMAVSYALRAVGFVAPMPLYSFVLTAVAVPFVAYIFAPWLGRQFRDWLAIP